jgi:hypothetical protein
MFFLPNPNPYARHCWQAGIFKRYLNIIYPSIRLLSQGILPLIESEICTMPKKKKKGKDVMSPPCAFLPCSPKLFIPATASQLDLYTLSRLGPPQKLLGFPAHVMSHSPAGAATDPAANELPQ